MRRWRPSASPASMRACPRSSRAASNSAWPSPGRWCSSPSVLLFDEPLSNLDARLRRQMREEIRDLQQRLGLTVVYVTHDQSEAMAVSDRIIVMNRAVIAQEGAPRELYSSSRSDAFVASFMGEANRVRGTLRRRDAVRGKSRAGPAHAVACPIAAPPDGEMRGRDSPGGDRAAADRRSRRSRRSCARRPISAT